MERSLPRSRPIEGLLLVDKPAGITSHDVIALARRRLGERRMGHLGTLDPFATGLLVLLAGRVTRLAAYMAGEPKVYEATIRFGVETDTDDVTGRPVGDPGPVPDDETVRRAIPSLTGSFDQEPPAYSARQVGGVRAYDAARRGRPIDLPPARVTVHRWLVRGWRSADELDVTITCGGGTYVRSLARDLGRRTGGAAHLSRLRRTRSGPFDVADAVEPDALDSTRLRSPLAGLADIPSVALTPVERARVVRGQSIDARGAGARAVLLGDDDLVVAIAEVVDGQWMPRVVLRDS